MVVAGVSRSLGALFLMVVFIGVPLPVMLFAALIGAALLVAGFPTLTTMTAEVVPASIRGLTFSVTSFLAALASAASPLLIGAIADQFDYDVDGAIKGNLSYAFLIVTPLVLIGGLVVLRGRKFVEADTVRAAALATELAAERRADTTPSDPRATSSRQASPRFFSIFSISAQCISSFRIVWRASSSRETSTPSLTRNNFL